MNRAVAVAAVLLVGWALLLVLSWSVVVLLHPGLGEGVAALDEAGVRWSRDWLGGRWEVQAVEVTFLASTLVGATAIVVASGFLWVARRRVAVLFLWTALVGGALLSSLLKAAFGRARPDVLWSYAHAFEASFPSGHALRAVVVYGGLGWLIWRLDSSRTVRGVTAALVAAAVIGIGASRVYLGVHFPSDVLAGYLLGLAWLVVCALAAEVAGGVTGSARERHPFSKRLPGA